MTFEHLSADYPLKDTRLASDMTVLLYHLVVSSS